MSRNYVQPGAVIDHTPASGVAVGDVVVMNGLVGVALVAIAANATGSVRIEGVFELPKNAPDAIGQGAQVYWDDTNNRVTTTASGNTLMGRAVKAAAAATTVCQVKLNV